VPEIIASLARTSMHHKMEEEEEEQARCPLFN